MRARAFLRKETLICTLMVGNCIYSTLSSEYITRPIEFSCVPHSGGDQYKIKGEEEKERAKDPGSDL